MKINSWNAMGNVKLFFKNMGIVVILSTLIMSNCSSIDEKVPLVRYSRFIEFDSVLYDPIYKKFDFFVSNKSTFKTGYVGYMWFEHHDLSEIRQTDSTTIWGGEFLDTLNCYYDIMPDLVFDGAEPFSVSLYQLKKGSSKFYTLSTPDNPPTPEDFGSELARLYEDKDFKVAIHTFWLENLNFQHGGLLTNGYFDTDVYINVCVHSFVGGKPSFRKDFSGYKHLYINTNSMMDGAIHRHLAIDTVYVDPEFIVPRISLLSRGW